MRKPECRCGSFRTKVRYHLRPLGHGLTRPSDGKTGTDYASGRPSGATVKDATMRMANGPIAMREGAGSHREWMWAGESNERDARFLFERASGGESSSPDR